MTKMNLIMTILLALPLVGIGLILQARRSITMPRLFLGLVGAGIAGAVFTALIVFMWSTVPIAPYETDPGAWTSIYEGCLLSLYVGFGLGVVLAGIVVSPFLYLKTLKKNKKEP